MLGNAQTLQVVRVSGGEGEEQGHRDESHPIKDAGETRQPPSGATPSKRTQALLRLLA
jgi:hypothetical protein